MISKVDAAASEIARQTSRIGYEKIDEAISKGGTRVDAHGQPFSQEMYLEMIDKVEMDFDRNGRPTQTIIAHPIMAKSMIARMEEWEQDEAFQKKYKELLQRKREAFLDRESDRKLVD